MTKKQLFIFFMAFAVAGLFMMWLGFFVLFDNSAFEKNAEPVRAEIVKIDTYKVDRYGKKPGTRDTSLSKRTYEEVEHDVYVTFTYNGELYENVKLHSWNAGMKEGDKINILCNPNNPQIIRPNDESFNLAGLIIILMALAFILFGGGLGAKMVLDDKMKKALLSNGRTIEATVTAVEQLSGENKEGVHPYRITCSYGSYIFKSEDIWSKSISFMYDVGDTIEVIVDPDDYTKYCFTFQDQ